MTDRQRTERGLEALLDLDGEILRLESGYWTKFEARRVEPNTHIPHGIKYSLTLHDGHNQRVLGYDNAHGVKPKRKNFAAKKTAWDHKHDGENVEAYEFESAGRLLEDFWADVDRILKAE